MADNILMGNPGNAQQIPRYGQQGQQALINLLMQGQNNMNNPYQGFQPIEQAARSNFQNKTLPTLFERFSGMGNNALSSPALMQNLAGHGVDLEERLAALRSSYGQNQQN